MVRRPADEDTFVIPAAWRRWVVPRRGGRVPAPAPPDADTAAADAAYVVARARSSTALRAGRGDPGLLDPAQAWLDDPATAGPLAAAATAALIADELNWPERRRYRVLVETWAATHGPAYAAVAAVHLADCARIAVGTATPAWVPPRYEHPHLLPVARALLAGASDDEYAAARAGLAGLRSGPRPERRIAVSFLLPTEHDWVDADCAAVVHQNAHPDTVAQLAMAAGTTRQLDTLRSALGRWQLEDPTLLYTMVDGLGPVLTELLEGGLDSRVGARGRRRIMAVLATTPTDDAFRTLLLHRGVDRQHAAGQLARACRRYPVRAARLLAEWDDDRLTDHVRAHPDAAAAALPMLTPAAADRLRHAATRPTGPAAEVRGPAGA
ncbi:MAG TPA: hypothetical protein VGN37_25610 [Actinocatenispora sp.]